MGSPIAAPAHATSTAVLLSPVCLRTGTAQASLEGLQAQGEILRRTKRRLYNLANTLGLSNSVMRFIETRASQDRVILWGGMAGTLFLMGLIYYYLA
jgi:Golgi SNAP receptor complex protein 2